jgi:hypothetical protein
MIAKVTADGKLEIPQEVLAKLQPDTEYEIFVKEIRLNFVQKNSQRLDTERIKTLSDRSWFRSKSTNARRN